MRVFQMQGPPVSVFVKEWGLENTWVRFPDGHEELFEDVVDGFALNGHPTVDAALQAALPAGCSLVVKG